MELEKARGISISSTAMTWQYNGEGGQPGTQGVCAMPWRVLNAAAAAVGRAWQAT